RRDALFYAKALEHAALPAGALAAPWSDRSLGERLVRVGDELVQIDADHPSEAATAWASAKRGFVREQTRRRPGQRALTHRTTESAGERRMKPRVGQRHARTTAAERPRTLYSLPYSSEL